MKTVSLGVLGLCFLMVGCGGEADDGGRKGGEVNNGKGDAGMSDDDEGASDDDEGASDDDASDDDASDDDASDDDASDDDVADDDVGDDDISTTPMPTMSPPGVPGTGVVPPPPVPGPMVPTDPGTPVEGCQVVGQSQGMGYCGIDQQCENGYAYSYCNQATDGTWNCECSDNLGYKQLQVTGAESPCAMVMELCPSVEVPVFTGEPTCAIEYQSAASDYCETQERCTQSEPVTDQVSVVQSTYNYSSCYTDGLGGLSCSCNGPTGYKSFVLSDTTATAACGVGTAICNGAAVAPADDRTCTVSYESATTTYCETQQTCSQAVSVDGVEVVVTDQEYAYCQSDNAGGATCNCSNSSRGYSFSVPAATGDAATCATALDVCRVEDPLVPEGPVECALYAQSASVGYCDATIQCTQNADVNGTTIGLNGSMYAYCQPDGDSFTCQCQSNTQSVPLAVQAADSWSACTEAAAQCPELVDVAIGSGGGIGRPCIGFASQDGAPADAAIAIPCAF